MNLSTLDQVKTKLKYDIDLFEDTFVDLDTELLGYINEAIDDAESVILNLYEDYFLTNTTVSLVSGTSEYSLPSDIFAAKIRAVLYSDGSSKNYEITKIKKLVDTLNVPTTDSYRYVIVNGTVSAATGSFKLKFYPTPAETNTNVTVWYIRNAKRLSSTSDYCDIPEFINFIYAHVRWNIARKERFPLDLDVCGKALAAQKDLMEKTLSDMIPTDDAKQVSPDFSFYADYNSTGLEY